MITSIEQLESMTEEDLLLERLEEGAGESCLFLPFVGEFGHEIMSHIRIVHFSKASEKIVCCRPGSEVLYPSATAFVTDWTDPVQDRRRAGPMASRRRDWPALVERFPGHQPIRSGELSRPQQFMVIRPEERISFRPRRRGLHADVVLGVRRREYAPDKNWPHWQRLANGLRDAGLSFAVVGHRSSSFDLDGQAAHSGNYDTDAAVELIQNCKLFVGSDTGSAHLASTIGVPMLVFREELGGHHDYRRRMAKVNHGHSFVALDGIWNRPDLIAAAAVAQLQAKPAGEPR